MSFLKEFKEFAMRGNLIDFAVGVVVGGAFGKVTSSFVDGIVMPVIGTLVGGTDFSDMKMLLHSGAKETLDAAGNVVTKAQPDVFLSYGAFITTVLDFVAVAFAMFLVIKAMNRMKRQEAAAPPAPPAPTSEELLLREIRDELKKR